MEKIKQSKKRWAWTEAQKRKHHPFSKWSCGAPKWYCKTFHKKYKNIAKKSLHKVKREYDPDTLDYRTHNHRNIAKWYWW